MLTGIKTYWLDKDVSNLNRKKKIIYVVYPKRVGTAIKGEPLRSQSLYGCVWQCAPGG